jgi:hypothetical protein
MIGARRRPTLVLAIYLVEAACAWVLAAPWAEVVARAVGAHPDGDRALFWADGMPLLFDLERRFGAVFLALGASTAIALSVWWVVGIALSGALLVGLSRDPGEGAIGAAVGRATTLFPKLFAVSALSVVVALVVFLLVGVAPSVGIATAMSESDPRIAALASFAPYLVAGAVGVLLFAVADLARARVVLGDGTFAAIGAAMRARPHRFVFTVAPRIVCSIGLLGYGAAFSTASHRIAAIFAVHQLVALGRVGLRASVLARALHFARGASARAD